MFNEKVSVVIPCYNAQEWITETIDSILMQTYPTIEIIVIDDGSSDRSLEIIKSYGNKLIWRSTENQGANKARNLGLSLATGKYIQYLDADDYLLPDKIAKQVAFLQRKLLDFVYGDWRYQNHLSSGEIVLGEIRVCGDKSDFLRSLLANDRWSNLAPMLFTRSILDRVTWDESLPAAQDRDYLFSLMLAGSKCGYLPGCDAIYRLHDGGSVSTTSKLRWFQAHCLVMEKVEQELTARGLLSAEYKQALAQSYWEMGQEYIYSSKSNNNQCPKSDHQEIQYQIYAQALDKVYQLNRNLFTHNKSKFYQTINRLLGYQLSAKLSYLFHYYKPITNY
ncbi:MAG: glycosyltransferase [Cyanobacteria bacterium P01_E01_bin.35]